MLIFCLLKRSGSNARINQTNTLRLNNNFADRALAVSGRKSAGMQRVTYLDDGLSSGDFQDLTLSGLSIAELHVHDLRVPIKRQEIQLEVR